MYDEALCVTLNETLKLKSSQLVVPFQVALSNMNSTKWLTQKCNQEMMSVVNVQVLHIALSDDCEHTVGSCVPAPLL